MHSNSPLYAAIDLGSNSFHMFVVRVSDNQIQVVERIKRKVRLAHGVDAQARLHPDAMNRGWDCLALFAESLRNIPADNIKIVATAALRSASNSSEFTDKANAILGHPIEIISGETEAQIIYQGACACLLRESSLTESSLTKSSLTESPQTQSSQTTSSQSTNDQQLMIDIGGASTEMIIGQGDEIKTLTSLSLGCVTWLDCYFSDHQLTEQNFNQAIQGAKDVLKPILDSYLSLGWGKCLGASGTVQTLQRIFVAQGLSSDITFDKLKQIQQQAIKSKTIENLDIEGLEDQQKLVLASGLSILIAIFEAFEIDEMNIANGALREGLVYGLLNNSSKEDEISNQSLQHLPFNFDNCIEK